MSVQGGHRFRHDTYMPQNATIAVAKRNEFAKGANIMAAENMNCPKNQAVSRSGLYLLTFVSSPAILLGGRGVNSSSSGEWMRSGKRNAPKKVTMENTTNAMLPIRPISPRASLDSFTSCGASYLKYVSPTHVLL
jgi:hypothetical protein